MNYNLINKFNVIDLFSKSDILVKISIIILIIFSIISWGIIIYQLHLCTSTQRAFKIFKNKFWSGMELSELYQEVIIHHNQFNTIEHIFYSGFKEFYRLYQIQNCTPKIIISRTYRIMHNTMNIELEKLERYIPLIGTIGSTSPYLGLFGTVLGIVHIFIELGKIPTIDTTIHNHMQMIAPGIAEALTSTAIGLFVAIPAVIAFNYFNVQMNNFNQNYNNFIEEFISVLHHQVFFNTDNSNITSNKNN